jgi:nicotinamide mononucleotide adenylyltransferase
MSFGDAIRILTGGNGAATQYLKTNTTNELTAAFQPEIKSALETVAIYQYWTPIVNAINKNKKSLGLTQDVQPNLENYVTEKALFAMFSEIEIQENAIRKDPIQRSSELLKKVFDYADKNQN